MLRIDCIVIVLVVVSSCKAQNPVVAIDANYSSASNGTYFKDLNNEMEKFVGTWLYNINGISFTLTLQKKESVFNGKHYEDILIGEYKYVSNGTEVVNTLPNINNPNPVKHKVFGNYVLPCNGCNNRKFNLMFEDSQRSYLNASITLNYLINSNPEQIKVILIAEDSSLLPTENSPTTIRVPYGTYIMTKQ